MILAFYKSLLSLLYITVNGVPFQYENRIQKKEKNTFIVQSVGNIYIYIYTQFSSAFTSSQFISLAKWKNRPNGKNLKENIYIKILHSCVIHLQVIIFTAIHTLIQMHSSICVKLLCKKCDLIGPVIWTNNTVWFIINEVFLCSCLKLIYPIHTYTHTHTYVHACTGKQSNEKTFYKRAKK